MFHQPGHIFPSMDQSLDRSKQAAERYGVLQAVALVKRQAAGNAKRRRYLGTQRSSARLVS